MPMFRLNTVGGPAGLMAVLLAMAAVQSAVAQDQAETPQAATAAPQPDAPSGQPKVLTGKERLGPKWTDEQRTDNCRVPVDKRGARPRPDTCSDGSTAGR
jgi:hypothetical protein